MDIIFQYFLKYLIQYILDSKKEHCSIRPETWNIGDTQDWNILHYGAYLDNTEMIDIGHSYFLNAASKFDTALAKKKSGQQKFLNRTNNWFVFIFLFL